LAYALNTSAQGIDFETGTWSEVLEKAQKENKPIFMDLYTTWCGPCKQMSANIFPQKEVGDVFNAAFINYKIDAEKGEGIELAKKYEVRAYPTYVFVSPTGELFFKSLGSMPATDFIKEADKALAEYHNSKPIATWHAEYEDHKSDLAFIEKYLEKRSKLKLNNTEVLDNYLSLLPVNEQTSEKTLLLIVENGEESTIESKAWNILKQNVDQISDASKKQEAQYIVSGAIDRTMRTAIKTSDETLMGKAIALYGETPDNAMKLSSEELWMRYYSGKKEWNNYVKNAILVAENKWMKLTPEQIGQKDAEEYRKFEEMIAKEDTAQIPAERLNAARKYYKTAYSSALANQMNSACWNIFQNVDDKATLKKAVIWSKKSLVISNNNPSYLDTYANLLYKSGKAKEAIKIQTEAIGNAGDDKKSLEETLEKMKKGEKTW
jgi:thioredoxin-related protein